MLQLLHRGGKERHRFPRRRGDELLGAPPEVDSRRAVLVAAIDLGEGVDDDDALSGLARSGVGQLDALAERTHRGCDAAVCHWLVSCPCGQPRKPAGPRLNSYPT